MSDASLPKVSVVIATRERPVLLHRAIRRVMEQTYAGEIELVIVFDQSEPHPIEVEIPAGRTLTVIRNTERSPGLAGARNTGVLATSGQYVAFCDDDDEWLPEKLTRQVAALAATPTPRSPPPGSGSSTRTRRSPGSSPTAGSPSPTSSSPGSWKPTPRR
jgi:glycosyltransferase involved in cell wall biosynthesis